MAQQQALQLGNPHRRLPFDLKSVPEVAFTQRLVDGAELLIQPTLRGAFGVDGQKENLDRFLSAGGVLPQQELHQDDIDHSL